jgi:hypothetical protein
MAPIVHRDPVQVEAARVAADMRVSLEDGYIEGAALS